MTVVIDEAEIRRPSRGPTSRLSTVVSRPPRALLAAGLGGIGLIAFTFGAFSFFGDLADPRARLPRPRAVASAMPDLRDGLPELVPTSRPAAPIVPAISPAAPVAALGPASLRTDAPAPSEATGSVARQAVAVAKPLPAIENAPTVRPDPKPAAVIAPLRLSNPLPPGKVETVRAKPVEEKSVTATPVARAPVAKAPEPAPAEATKRAVVAAAKPAREKPVRAASAESVPAARATTPRREAAEESDDLGSKVTKGIKAIGGIFSSDD